MLNLTLSQLAGGDNICITKMRRTSALTGPGRCGATLTQEAQSSKRGKEEGALHTGLVNEAQGWATARARKTAFLLLLLPPRPAPTPGPSAQTLHTCLRAFLVSPAAQLPCLRLPPAQYSSSATSLLPSKEGGFLRAGGQEERSQR